MHRLFLLLAVLFVVPVCSADSPKEYDDKTEIAGIEGTWRLVDLTVNGQKVDYHEVATFRGGTYYGFEQAQSFEKPYHIDAARTPAHLDYTQNGTVVKCIYHVHGDTLRIAIRCLDWQRPQDFHNPWLIISTYKRVK
jgi:uncharacterized protein (TIGR03067 family)